MEKTKEPTFVYYFYKDSTLLRIPFFIKLILLVIISTMSLIYSNLAFLFGLSLIMLILIFITGFPLYNFKPLKFILVSIIIFSLFWLLFSNIPGDEVYLRFIWGTSISNLTLEKMFFAVGKWVTIVFGGLLFIITTSEKQLINFLENMGLPKRFILTVTIAFNTLAFFMEDIKNIEHSINSRNVRKKGFIWMIKRKYLLGNTLFLSNIKRIDSLYQSYLFRS
ncbi:hypothetical protein COU60_05205 [Candidatus Pacearchaeota archaeon CG10_big_fil_rev_8_21_14_0_10_34_76]|nr:MAG: hypothetical protein COU60_05205 [Candidatus Pacearchaeota archaeon CG10_big_fil_rev_8_21_14_0_10_34_76]